MWENSEKNFRPPFACPGRCRNLLQEVKLRPCSLLGVEILLCALGEVSGSYDLIVKTGHEAPQTTS